MTLSGLQASLGETWPELFYAHSAKARHALEYLLVYPLYALGKAAVVIIDAMDSFRRLWLSEQVLHILLGEFSHERPQLAHEVIIGRR
jgi:hypothetical protein